MALVKITDSINTTSSEIAASATAVKSAYDLANTANATASSASTTASSAASTASAAMPKAGGTFTGAVTAANDTAYTTYKVRNAAIVSATPSSMTNGTIAFVYS